MNHRVRNWHIRILRAFWRNLRQMHNQHPISEYTTLMALIDNTLYKLEAEPEGNRRVFERELMQGEYQASRPAPYSHAELLHILEGKDG